MDRTMANQTGSNNIIWLNEQDRIASFHHVEGYHIRQFQCRDFFMTFLSSLQERGYRFQ